MPQCNKTELLSLVFFKSSYLWCVFMTPSNVDFVSSPKSATYPPKSGIHSVTSVTLGVIILEGGVTRMDPVKVEGVRNWPACKNLTDARAFLGFCNYYHMFIPGFAHHAKPLTLL